MERIKIDKERTWVFSPVNNIVMKVDIKGNILEAKLKEAIRNTVSQYEMLHQKITLDQEGNAYYEKSESFEPLIRSMNLDWTEVAKEQEKIPFAIDQGEFIRYFYKMTEERTTLMIIAHHIAGDGVSFTYFIEDIMRSLTGVQIQYKKLELFHMEKLPKDARLRAPITCLMKYMNRRWRKTGRLFDFNDYYNMYDKCWSNRESLIYTYVVEDDMFDVVQKFSKENNITINSLITTAFIRASGERSDVGLAASIREKGFTGMGNYATGISVKYQYNDRRSFLENARTVQNMIYDKLNNESKKFFLLQFMRNIEPSLVDAIYFNVCSDYNNQTAETFSKMFGYSGNPKGISITNLTKLPIETKFEPYEIVDFVFVPPLVLNAKRIIGIASIGEKIVFSLHLNNDKEAKEHLSFFYKAMEYLQEL